MGCFDVDLTEYDIGIEIIVRKFFINWRDNFARSTPRSREIYHNSFIFLDLNKCQIFQPFETVPVDDKICDIQSLRTPQGSEYFWRAFSILGD